MLMMKTLQWSYFTLAHTHHHFYCVNKALGSTGAIQYAAAHPLTTAEATQILTDHISPALERKSRCLSHYLTGVVTDTVVLFFST